MKPRSRTLVEMAEGAAFYFAGRITYEEKGDKKFLKANVLPYLEELEQRLAGLEEFNEKALEEFFAAYLEEKDLKLGKIAQPLRVALTGKTASPGLFEVMDVLGREEVLRRIGLAAARIREKQGAAEKAG